MPHRPAGSASGRGTAPKAPSFRDRVEVVPAGILRHSSTLFSPVPRRKCPTLTDASAGFPETRAASVALVRDEDEQLRQAQKERLEAELEELEGPKRGEIGA